MRRKKWKSIKWNGAEGQQGKDRRRTQTMEHEKRRREQALGPWSAVGRGEKRRKERRRRRRRSGRLLVLVDQQQFHDGTWKANNRSGNQRRDTRDETSRSTSNDPDGVPSTEHRGGV